MKYGRHTLLPALTLLGALLALPPEPAAAVDAADVPPDFTLHAADGRKVTLGDFRGKVVYLDFWASWCGPCKQTLPWMQSLEQRYGKSGFEVVAVNLDVNAEDAQALLREVRPTFTVLYDPAGDTAGRYEVPTMPTSFLIGRDGYVHSVHSGSTDEDRKALEHEIATLVATPAENKPHGTARARFGGER